MVKSENGRIILSSVIRISLLVLAVIGVVFCVVLVALHAFCDSSAVFLKNVASWLGAGAVCLELFSAAFVWVRKKSPEETAKWQQFLAVLLVVFAGFVFVYLLLNGLVAFLAGVFSSPCASADTEFFEIGPYLTVLITIMALASIFFTRPLIAMDGADDAAAKYNGAGGYPVLVNRCDFSEEIAKCLSYETVVHSAYKAEGDGRSEVIVFSNKGIVRYCTEEISHSSIRHWKMGSEWEKTILPHRRTHYSIYSSKRRKNVLIVELDKSELEKEFEEMLSECIPKSGRR